MTSSAASITRIEHGIARGPLKAADEQEVQFRIRCGCSCLEVKIDSPSRRFVMVATAAERLFRASIMQRVPDLASAVARRARLYGSPRFYEMFISGSTPAMMVLLVWLHMLAAVSWIGGMIFLSLVMVPLVRSGKPAPEFMASFRSAARRFRVVVWGAIALLLGTGPVLLHQRGLSFFDPTGWPHVLRIKLGLVGALILLTVAHDLLLASQVRKISAIPEGARSSWERMIVCISSWVPRVALLLALSVLAAAVMLARS